MMGYNNMRGLSHQGFKKIEIVTLTPNKKKTHVAIKMKLKQKTIVFLAQFLSMIKPKVEMKNRIALIKIAPTNI